MALDTGILTFISITTIIFYSLWREEKKQFYKDLYQTITYLNMTVGYMTLITITDIYSYTKLKPVFVSVYGGIMFMFILSFYNMFKNIGLDIINKFKNIDKQTFNKKTRR